MVSRSTLRGRTAGVSRADSCALLLKRTNSLPHSSLGGDGSFVAEVLSEAPPLVAAQMIDPGEHNIFKSVPGDAYHRPIPKDEWGGEVRSHCLSRATYYNQTFITKGTDKFNKWKNKRQVRLVLNAHSQNSPKTVIPTRLNKRIRRYFQMSSELWRHMAEPAKWKSLSHYLKNKKQSVLQRAVNNLMLDEHRRNGTRPIIFLGNGGRSTGFWFRGSRAVPQYFKDLLIQNGFQVRMVDEFRTR